MSLTPPAVLPVTTLLPAEPLLLMGAGPTPLPEEVSVANGMITDHLGPVMGEVLQGIKALARYAFQTEAEHTLGISGPSSAAMEMAIANLLWPGRRALCLVNGTFSARLADMARGVGAEVVELAAPPLAPVQPAQVAEALAAHGPFDLVTLVQGETSCGVHNVYLPEIARLARDAGSLVMADTVCTLSTTPFQMDDWGVDVAVTGGQKGLACIPGVSLISFNDRAWAVVEQGPRPFDHWCLDARRAWRFWGEHQYHYTAPVPGLLAMYEALRLIAEETLPARIHRHKHSAAALAAGLEAAGLSLLIADPGRLRSVNAINVPAGVDPDAARAWMLAERNVQISGAFGLNIVRIGQMGEQCRPDALRRVLSALLDSFAVQGAPIDVAAGMAALEAALPAT